MQADEIYADTRRRIVSLARGLDDERAQVAVAACPGWSVRDVVAHLAGVAADVASGRLDGAGTPQWTARQVGERTGRTTADLVAEWDQHSPAVEAFVAERTGIVPFVVDVVTHEQDIRGALGEPAAVDSVGFDSVLQRFVMALDKRLRQEGLPALHLRAGDEEWTVGDGGPAATVTTTPVEVFRVLAGRRSADQVRRYRWDGDPEPYLEALSVFGPLPPDDVIER